MNSSLSKQDWLKKTPDPTTGKKLNVIAWILTGAVLILVGLMRRPELRIPLPEGFDFGFLPPIHAAINTIVSLLLIGAIISVWKGNITLHRNFMISAMGFSVVFLLCYVAYHFTSMETLYGDSNGDYELSPEEITAVGSARTNYLILLITHIVAAAVSLPLILMTFISAWTNQFKKHKKMARWVFPIWLYVAITGPICYFMLRPYY